MTPWIIAILVAVFLLGGVIFMFAYTMPIAKNVYEDQLVKTSKDRWLRVCSAPENEEQVAMWNEGLSWAEAHKDVMEPVHIEHDGLSLFGEYYDFGSDKCVMIIPGRCECLIYSYFFAKPYSDMGMNVLVIDQRAHGKSDGKYNTVGVQEHRDAIAWVHFLEEKKGIQSVWFHAICIGSVTAILASNAQDAPSSIHGIVLEGTFISFRETFKRHMMDINKPIFPVLDEVMWYIKKYTGASMRQAAPIRHVGELKVPVLFLYGKQDVFSIPEKSRILYEKCGSPDKEIEWFEKGPHSHLRLHNHEQYDSKIISFVSARD